MDKKIRSLSGGEKTRLVMARMLLEPPNFLVLDEPTNHLDLATKEMLLESLAAFDGTMIFVSHDRAFLRGLSNRVLELEARAARVSSRTSIPGRMSITSRAPVTKPRVCTRSYSSPRPRSFLISLRRRFDCRRCSREPWWDVSPAVSWGGGPPVG